MRTDIILHSGDMDKIYSALIIANGALAMGMEASIYFTFWGLIRLKKGELDKGPLSKMNLLEIGRQMIKKRMNKANAVSLEKLMMIQGTRWKNNLLRDDHGDHGLK